MRINKRVGWSLCAAAILGFGSALNAAPVVLVNDTFEQETLGDNSSQLTNWANQGTATNGTIIDTDPGAGENKAFRIGQLAGIQKSGLNLTTGNPGNLNPVQLSIKFDFTDVAVANDYFAFFWRDQATGNPLYRVQWNAGIGGGAIVLRKTNTQLGSFAVPAGFWNATHNIELTVLFDPGTNSMTGTNTLELFLDGVSQGTRQDIGGVTDDDGSQALPAGNLRRLLPTSVSSIQLQNFNNEAGALNILDNVSISYETVIPEPASLALLAIGGAMMFTRRNRR